jgi:hypothetical protein
VTDGIDDQVAALAGSWFSQSSINRIMDEIWEKRLVTAELGYAEVLLKNCTDNQLDVVFRVFSIQIPPLSSSSLEYRQQLLRDPLRSLQIPVGNPILHLNPQFSYDATNRWLAGGRLSVKKPLLGGLISSASIEGQGSPKTQFISANLSGEHDSVTSWFAHSDWILDYVSSSIPLKDASLDQGRLAVQGITNSHPLGGLTFRLAGFADFGHWQSSIAAHLLPPGFVSNTSYNSIRLAAGLTFQSHVQALNASYGFQLGAAGDLGLNGWRKHLGSVAQDLTIPVHDHRLLEIEHQLVAGGIQIVHSVPVGETFFGGNRQDNFLLGDSWLLPSNPYIRSVPASQFRSSSSAYGGTEFFSYNTTPSFTVWRRPMVPAEVTTDSDFIQKLNGALDSSVSILQIAYVSKDAHFQSVLSSLPTLQTKLVALSSVVQAAISSASTSDQAKFSDCTDAIDGSTEMLSHAVRDKPVQAYGSVQELLPNGDGSIDSVVSACGKDLDPTLETPQIAASVAELDVQNKNIQHEFGLIDQNSATQKANSDISSVRQTLHVLLNEVNIAELAPIGAFDVAGIYPDSSSSYGGIRYGAGGGVRFSLASSARFTIGYSVNPSPRSGEPRGAFFFSITMRNLFP